MVMGHAMHQYTLAHRASGIVTDCSSDLTSRTFIHTFHTYRCKPYHLNYFLIQTETRRGPQSSHQLTICKSVQQRKADAQLNARKHTS
eukprot:scaffold693_cov200-Alexandrium_tamarense.AAC.97